VREIATRCCLFGRLLRLPLLSNCRQYVIDRFASSPLAYRLARGAIWSVIGAMVSRLLALVASVFVARVLVKEAYGALGVIQSTVGVFGGVAGFGLAIAATKYVSEYRASDPERTGRIIAFASLVTCLTGAIVSSVLWLCSDYLARHFLAGSALAPELRIGALLLFLGTLNTLQMGILSGFEAFRAIAVANLWSGLAAAPVQMAAAWFAGLRGSVWGLVITSLLNVAFAHLALTKTMRQEGVRPAIAGCTREVRLVGGFGSSLALAGLVVAYANWMATAFVVNENAGYSEMAALNASNNWFGIVVFFIATVQQGIFPAVSEFAGRGNRPQLLKLLRLSTSLTLKVATPIAILGIVASPWIMGLYGRGFAHAWPVLCLTIATAWVYCFHVFLNQMLLALDRPKWFLFTHSLWGAILVGLVYARIREGAVGFAVSRLVAYVVIVAVTSLALSTLLRPGHEASAL
jgi:O-antigen/teichoic acid export membrane protein